MLNKVVNGYTIIAQEFVSGHGYIILGHRLVGPMQHEYVTAWMNNPADVWWASGDYTRSLTVAVESFKQRRAIREVSV
jgi:hypothetical protein